MIALFIDVTRVSRYLSGGIWLEQDLLIALILSIPVSFIGAHLAKRFLARVPQRSFRVFVGVFLGLVGAKLLVWT